MCVVMTSARKSQRHPCLHSEEDGGTPHMGLSKTASHDPLPLADFNLCFFAVINHNQLQIVLGALLVNY